MKYNSDFFYNVMINELGYKDKIFPFCRCIELDPLDAFRYVVFSNSGYLDLTQLEKRLIIRKDLFRIFNQAEKESIQHGLFDGNVPQFKYTANYFFRRYPSITSNIKHLIFLEYKTKIRIGEPPYYPLLKKLNEEIIEHGLNPMDFIITLIPSDSSPKDLESFFEYVINEKYRRKGYLTDSQLPFYYGVGTPDAGVYSNDELSANVFVPLMIPGATIIDLMCLKYLPKSENINKAREEFVVFEVKTGSVDGSQIKKYIEQNIFDKAYEVIPHKKEKSNYAGLIHFNNSGNIIEEKSDTLTVQNKDKYIEWLNTYIKCFLMTNMSDELFEKYKIENNILTTRDLIEKLKRTAYSELIGKVMEG